MTTDQLDTLARYEAALKHIRGYCYEQCRIGCAYKQPYDYKHDSHCLWVEIGQAAEDALNGVDPR